MVGSLHGWQVWFIMTVERRRRLPVSTTDTAVTRNWHVSTRKLGGTI